MTRRGFAMRDKGETGKRAGGRANRFIAVALLGVIALGCRGDAVPDDSEPPREIELGLGEPDPELSDEGEGSEPGETVAVRAKPSPPPASSPIRRAPTQAPPSAPDPEPQDETTGNVQVEPEPEPEPVIQYLTLTASPGSELEVELLETLSTRDNRPGDRFEAAVTRPLIDGGLVLVPVNSLVRGEVTAVQRSGGSGEEAIIKVTFHDVFFHGESWPMSASVVEASPRSEGNLSTGDKAARIGAGAVVGGILGRVIGGNSKGTVIGAAVGAAAGTAITLATEDADAVLELGSIMRLRLDAPLVIRLPDPMGD
ncbi:MAG: hypothetical protein MJB57_15690 [Gemmatimonadetes bacterium]|nr:hypothetical protein [Gemmatimonadota bacterium]